MPSSSTSRARLRWPRADKPAGTRAGKRARRAASSTRAQAGWHEGWQTCSTCGQFYTGAVRLGLARVRCRDDPHQLAAATFLGVTVSSAGKLAEAAGVRAGILAASKWVHGKSIRAAPPLASRPRTACRADSARPRSCRAGCSSRAGG